MIARTGYNCSYLLTGLFETLPARVQCEMLLKATEQCFNTLEKAEMLLLLLKRFPESVVQHGVCNAIVFLLLSHRQKLLTVFVFR